MKNASRRFQEHERSDIHVSSIKKLKDFERVKVRIDEKLLQQYNAECSYWRAVLERVVAVIKFLAERGLPFRGHDEIVGSKSNGNYLRVLELISKLDPFLAAHMEKHTLQLPEKDVAQLHTYHQRCAMSLEIMGQVNYIISELKAAIYFSVSIDSIPDASNVYRLTCIMRYVPEKSPIPVERFMKFLGIEGHTAQQLANSLFAYLEECGIDVKNCRGQSYDNASNMAGKYHSVQTLIRERSSLAFYISCFGHSLNLVGNNAMDSVPMALYFFWFIQNVYTFLSASTHR